MCEGRDRKQLERLCRYLLRPPFAHDAVKALPDGRVRVLFKASWRSGEPLSPGPVLNAWRHQGEVDTALARFSHQG